MEDPGSDGIAARVVRANSTSAAAKKKILRQSLPTDTQPKKRSKSDGKPLAKIKHKVTMVINKGAEGKDLDKIINIARSGFNKASKGSILEK